MQTKNTGKYPFSLSKPEKLTSVKALVISLALSA